MNSIVAYFMSLKPVSTKVVATQFTSNELLDAMLGRVTGTSLSQLKASAYEMSVADSAAMATKITKADGKIAVAEETFGRIVTVHGAVRDARVAEANEDKTIATSKKVKADVLVAALAPQA